MISCAQESWDESVDACASALVRMACEEDHAMQDVTSEVMCAADEACSARLVAREPATLAGLPLVAEVYRTCAPGVDVAFHFIDGNHVVSGDIVADITGPARGVLCGERTALNFLQRLSGIATATWRFVEAISGHAAVIVDTRKTTPGWRALEKYAVRCGGGVNHRMDLASMIMMKDNHWAVTDQTPEEAIAAARAAFPDVPIACEADTYEQVVELLDCAPDLIMLDNMSLDDMRRAVHLCGGRITLEATGGITRENVRAVAETGVDRLSVGAVTHSVPAIDFSLEVLV